MGDQTRLLGTQLAIGDRSREDPSNIGIEYRHSLIERERRYRVGGVVANSRQTTK